MKDKKIKIGQLLLECLTGEQIACMLDVVASAGGLKKMKAGPGLHLAMDVWKEHLHLIVPDPANVYKSDHSHHAAWCKAVHELNQNTYQALLSRWRKKHNRHRNLWRDMKAIGLSV